MRYITSRCSLAAFQCFFLFCNEYKTNQETSPGFSLGDRVMNLCDTGPIPFGLTGTVTGVVANLLEVVFDEEFLGGTNLDDRFRASLAPYRDACLIW